VAFLDLFFGSSQARRTTATDPLKLRNPTLSFLNLMGDSGQILLETDAAILSPLFGRTVKSATHIIILRSPVYILPTEPRWVRYGPC
jgi:hypothetical protein